MSDLEPIEIPAQLSGDREPFWLKYFTVKVCCALDIDLECKDCGYAIGNFDAFYGDETTLWDLKERAYEHIEECGK